MDGHRKNSMLRAPSPIRRRQPDCKGQPRNAVTSPNPQTIHNPASMPTPTSIQRPSLVDGHGPDARNINSVTVNHVGLRRQEPLLLGRNGAVGVRIPAASTAPATSTASAAAAAAAPPATGVQARRRRHARVGSTLRLNSLLLLPALTGGRLTGAAPRGSASSPSAGSAAASRRRGMLRRRLAVSVGMLAVDEVAGQEVRSATAASLMRVMVAASATASARGRPVAAVYRSAPGALER